MIPSFFSTLLSLDIIPGCKCKYRLPAFRISLYIGHDNAFSIFSSSSGRFRDFNLLFDLRHGGRSPGTETATMEEPPRQRLHLPKLTRAILEERMYSREHLCKERVASLRCWFAGLELHLTCSRRTLSILERKRYVAAVLCLRSVKPALYEHEVRGTSSRYDDFQAVHINQSFIIHGNVYLSTGHKNQSMQLI